MSSEYATYRYWSYLPSLIRGLSKEELMRVYKVDDLRLLAIAPIRTQTEFAAKFGIKDLGTLTDWNQRIQSDGPPPTNPALRHVMREALAALYLRLIIHGRAKDFKMFAAYVEGWTPQQISPTEYKREKVARRTQRQLHVMLSKPRQEFLDDIEELLRKNDWNPKNFDF